MKNYNVMLNNKCLYLFTHVCDHLNLLCNVWSGY